MSRSTRSPRPRAASGRAGCPSPTSSRKSLGALPSVDRDLDELVERGLELLLARALEPPAQDGDELGLRPPVDEHDEPEAERLLVRAVQVVELRRRGVGALLGRAASAQAPPGANRRVRVEHRLLLVVCERARDLARAAERVLERGELLDEARAPLEQLRELVRAQLPR